MSRRNFNNSKRIDTCVTVRAEECNNNPEKMVRKFSKLVKKHGIIDECRERAFFTKPTTKRAEQKRQRQRVIDKVNKRRTELFTIKDRSLKRRK